MHLQPVRAGIILIFREVFTVQLYGAKAQFIAVQNERSGSFRTVLPQKREGCRDKRLFGVELNIQMDLVDAICWRLIVFQPDGRRRFGTHRGLPKDCPVIQPGRVVVPSPG